MRSGGTYQANPPESDTRNVYFNNAVTAFGKVEVVFGKEDATGSITWMNGEASENAEWAKKKLANDNGSATDYSKWTYGWLTMSPASKSSDGHSLPANVWVFEGVPKEYTYVAFRGSIDPNASDASGNNFYFSPWLTIDGTYAHPCFSPISTSTPLRKTLLRTAKSSWGIPGFWTASGVPPWSSTAWATTAFRFPAAHSKPRTTPTTARPPCTTTTPCGRCPAITLTSLPILATTSTTANRVFCSIWLVSEYYEQLPKTPSFEFRPLYFGADNMRNEYNGSTPGWTYQLSDPASKLHKYGTLYKTQKLYNNTDDANVWEGNDGSRTAWWTAT